MTLTCETHAAPDAALEAALVATTRDVTRLRGDVAFVAAGTLANDGKVIEDIRKLD